MSFEIQKISHHFEQPQQRLTALEFNHETGAINFDGLAAAFHGVRAAISQKRMEWAEDREERMDHKDTLYSSLGGVPMNGIDATAAGVGDIRPRSYAERFMDKRQEKKEHEITQRAARQKRVNAAFGGPRANTTGFASKVDRLQRKNEVRSRYRAGDLTAAEMRLEKNLVIANPLVAENQTQRKARRVLGRADKELDTITRQPVLRRWRNWRRNEAIKDQRRHQENTIKHRQRQADARS